MVEPFNIGCITCGWTLDNENQCHYTSQLKPFLHRTSTQGVWSIGSEVILKGQLPDEDPISRAKIKVKTMNYLATHPDIDIRVPKVIHDWVDRDGRFLRSEPMHRWPSLFDVQKKSRRG